MSASLLRRLERLEWRDNGRWTELFRRLDAAKRHALSSALRRRITRPLIERDIEELPRELKASLQYDHERAVLIGKRVARVKAALLEDAPASEDWVGQMLQALMAKWNEAVPEHEKGRRLRRELPYGYKMLKRDVREIERHLRFDKNGLGLPEEVSESAKDTFTLMCEIQQEVVAEAEETAHVLTGVTACTHLREKQLAEAENPHPLARHALSDLSDAATALEIFARHLGLPHNSPRSNMYDADGLKAELLSTREAGDCK